jgi:hypothetical protein
MTKLKTLHDRWPENPAYKEAYDALVEEIALAAAIAVAPSRAGLTQEEIARMHTTQGNIARLEAGRTTPSTRTLEWFARAVGCKTQD